MMRSEEAVSCMRMMNTFGLMLKIVIKHNSHSLTVNVFIRARLPLFRLRKLLFVSRAFFFCKECSFPEIVREKKVKCKSHAKYAPNEEEVIKR